MYLLITFGTFKYPKLRYGVIIYNIYFAVYWFFILIYCSIVNNITFNHCLFKNKMCIAVEITVFTSINNLHKKRALELFFIQKNILFFLPSLCAMKRT